MMASGIARYQSALETAAARARLDASDAVALHIRANAVYHLRRSGIVVRIRYTPAGQDTFAERASAAVQVTRWLVGQRFPATEPLDIDQPITVPGHVATFWRYVAVTSGGHDAVSLGRLVRQLHSLPPAPVTLPAANVIGSLRADLDASLMVPDDQRQWLLARADELEREYQHFQTVLGTGLVHGDAHTGNLLRTADREVLADWDSVGYGPREMDMVPMRLGYRFARSPAEWQAFCAAYGVDPGGLRSLPLLEHLRELHGLAAYIRNADNPAFRAELAKRISSIATGSQAEPWRAL